MHHYTEAATRGVPWKKVFLKISQNSQENTCTRASFLIKFERLRLQFYNFIKNETLAQVFSCEFCETFKNRFLQNTSGRLLLTISTSQLTMCHSNRINFSLWYFSNLWHELWNSETVSSSISFSMAIQTFSKFSCLPRLTGLPGVLTEKGLSKFFLHVTWCLASAATESLLNS